MELPSGWGRGAPSCLKPKAGFQFKRRHPVFPALSRRKLRPHARGPCSSAAPGPLRPHTHQSSGPARPAQAQLRGGGQGARARSEGPRRPALGRTAAGGGALALTLPGAPPGQPHSLPARPMPSQPGPRPRLGGRTHRLAPRLRRTPQGPAERAGSTPGLGGTTGLKRRGWPGGPPPGKHLRVAAGPFRAGDRPSRNKRAIPPSRIAPGEAAEGTFPRPTPALPPPQKKWEKRRAPGALFPLSSSWGRARMVLLGVGKACGVSNPKEGPQPVGDEKGSCPQGRRVKLLKGRESLLGFSRIPSLKKSWWNECEIIADWIR
ncbi:basic proline-rich protein-like [Physeter macrocephalus]|uniref:Basic proline-rich protein-like n=1 Tax=Physeter macrocephalus TaxID=9755 RepID=A0A2Y9SNS9_PHYMC|nr:basic proline-rich protein-like [Physeter catodon]|eukprot:XP_023979963.1 basic proline-rich protein-like [Physeter catodon]